LCCEEAPSYEYYDGSLNFVDTLCLDIDHDYKITVMAVDIYGDTNIVQQEIELTTGSVDHCLPAIPVMDKPAVPATYELSQNWPNPFNASTVIDFGLPEDGHVAFGVYDVLGRRIRVLIDGYRPAGYHSVTWNGRDNNGREVASGIYFYRLTTKAFTESRKMVLVK
jgi:hypothetical protein